MRILFCQTVPYLPEDAGGGLLSTHLLCRGLIGRGHRVEVSAGRRRQSSLLGRLASFRSGARLEYEVSRSDEPLKQIDEVCRRFKPDVAVVQFENVAGLVRALSRHDVPVVVFFHDVFGLRSAAEIPADARVSYATCSPFLTRRTREDLGREAKTLPVIIEPDDFRVEGNGKVVTFINPIPRKGAEIAFALAARRPDVSFEFVEAWPLRTRVVKYLKDRIAHYGNIRFVHFTPDMRSVYGHSRIVLAPSLGDEGWGRVASEAQVSGIPVLASNSGGLADAVGPGGIVVDRDAPISEWVSAFARLWDDPTEYGRLSRAARDYAARAEFQPAAILEAFDAMIARAAVAP